MRKIKFCQLWLLWLRWIRSWIGSRNLGWKISSSSDLFSVKKLFQNQKKGGGWNRGMPWENLMGLVLLLYLAAPTHRKFRNVQIQLINHSSTIQLLSSGIAWPPEFFPTKIGSIQNQTPHPHLPKPKKYPAGHHNFARVDFQKAFPLEKRRGNAHCGWHKWATKKRDPPTFHYNWFVNRDPYIGLL